MRHISEWLGPVVLVAAVALLAAVVARSAIDRDAVREAARQGTLDAYAQMGTSGPASNPDPAASVKPVADVTFDPAGRPFRCACPCPWLRWSQGGPPGAGICEGASSLRAPNRLGDPNAPIIIIEFSDFQCPYCGKFFEQTEPALIREYVETGKVQFVYKHFAFLGNASILAAQASECAADQGAFWPYHDRLFDAQSGENGGAFSQDNLIVVARDLGLDMARFERCLKNGETLARVEADRQEAARAGLHGTPTFLVNGRPLYGAQPIEAFREVLGSTRP